MKMEALVEQAKASVCDLYTWELWVYMVGATVTGIVTAGALLWLGRWLFEWISWRWPW
jgi:hypothetical protein